MWHEEEEKEEEEEGEEEVGLNYLTVGAGFLDVHKVWYFEVSS